MNRILTMLTAAAAFTAVSVALAGDCCRSNNCREGRCVTCGDKVCTAQAVPAKETKTCFLTECKDICIPKIRFPWQKCCKPQCGRVISVRVLKIKEYECKTCKWEWKIKSCAACDAGCCFKHHSSDKQAEPPVPPAPGAVSMPYVEASHVPTP